MDNHLIREFNTKSIAWREGFFARAQSWSGKVDLWTQYIDDEAYKAEFKAGWLCAEVLKVKHNRDLNGRKV